MHKFTSSLIAHAREVICVTEMPDYPVRHVGSGALFLLEGEVFFITAAHTIKDCRIEDIRILYSIHRKEYMPMEKLYRPDPVNDDDPDYVDVAIIHMDSKLLDFSLFGYDQPFPLQWFDVGLTMDPISRYIFVGSPSSLRDFDYERKSVEFVILEVEADLGERIDKLIYTLNFRKLADLDIDGMSGSPVFQIHYPYSGFPTVSYAGVVQRGNGPHGIVRILHADQIFGYLKNILRQLGWTGQTPYCPD
jgi:hypothetical protein